METNDKKINIEFEGEETLTPLTLSEIIEMYPLADERPQMVYKLENMEGLLSFKETSNVFTQEGFLKLKVDLYDKMFEGIRLPLYNSMYIEFGEEKWLMIDMLTKDDDNPQHIQIGITLWDDCLFFASVAIAQEFWYKWEDLLANVINTLKFDAVKSDYELATPDDLEKIK